MTNSFAQPSRLLKRFCMPLLALVTLSSALFGQGFGTIVGTVTDQSGAVMAGAKVTITDPAKGQGREETTNDQGYYVFPSLKPTAYDVSVSASGFGISTQKGVTLLADQSATVNATLAL